MIRTIVLDFGNVIGHFDHAIACAALALQSPLGPDDIRAAVHDGPLEDAFERGDLTSDQFVREAVKAIKYRGGDAEFVAAYSDIFTANDAVCAVLPALARKYRLVLASNTNPLHARQFRRQFREAMGFFTALGLSFEAKARKPEPAFFRYVQGMTAARPQECLFFDDIIDNVEAARAIGWNAHVYTPDLDLRHVVASYND